jgi:hypothetical protein
VRRRRLPEPFVYFVDECLGRHIVPDALRAALDPSERLVVMPQGTLDPAWIPLADKAGWVCFTKDRALSRVPNERRALLSANAAIFMIGEASGPAHAERIVRSLPVLRRVLRVNDVPLLARIEPDGVIVLLYERGELLPTPRRVRPKIRERGS